MIKQLHILGLIWVLLLKFLRHGNLPVFYHICGHDNSWNNPMEAEIVEIRIGSGGEKRLTLW